ncbi:hypothetical protein MBA17_17665 [Streptosporangium sp. KLBMP 9127]|nr:hypothetical protein [Streptosporangium sp. KLBMP 9127]
MRDELRSLPNDLADLISRHLVAAERALGEDEPEQAYEHAKVARRFAARIGVVREAAGVTAYRAGQFAEALGDLRAARRMTGSDAYLPIMADCERGLGRPERALDLVKSKEAERLDRSGRIELTIVESGARRDLGQQDAAVVALQRLPELRDTRPQPWSARLAYAYADALADAGHETAATDWFGRAMAFDEEGETEAAERYAELTGELIEDLEEDYEETDEIDDLAALDAQIEEEDDLDEGDYLSSSSPEPVRAGSDAAPASDSDEQEDVRGDRATAEESVDEAEEVTSAQPDAVQEDAETVAEDGKPSAGRSAGGSTVDESIVEEPGVDESAAEEPDPGQKSEAVKSDAVKSEAVKSDAVKSEAVKSEAVKSEAVKSAADQDAKLADAGTEDVNDVKAIPIVEVKIIPGAAPAFIEPDFGDVGEEEEEESGKQDD